MVRLSKSEGYHSDSEVVITILFKGTEEEYASSESIILDIPGGG